jgi:uroporphyrin-III C-methyltransferase / precorrin-2 dehydrogenase / sirohydrochlorin ferrochelatase
MTTPPTHNPARIASMAVLPVFFKLQNKRVVLAGGSLGAAWKVELLVACGAYVDVYTIEPEAEMLQIAVENPTRVRLHHRPWSYDVMQGAAMAIGGIEDDEEGQAFRCAAKYAGVPVNVVDRPAFCDFSFGGIVNRSPLIIGISTDGAAPVFGQAIRAKIDALLPMSFQRWAQKARDWRVAVKASGLSFAARRSFWQLFAREAVSNPNSEPTDAQRKAWLAQITQGVVEAKGKGSVVFVADGGGDADMLTMKAVRMLQSAEALVYDEGLPTQILDLARREARKIVVNDDVDVESLLGELVNDGVQVVRVVKDFSRVQ